MTDHMRYVGGLQQQETLLYKLLEWRLEFRKLADVRSREADEQVIRGLPAPYPNPEALVMTVRSMFRAMEAEKAATVWKFYKGSLLLPIHAFILLASLIGFVKGEWRVAPLFVSHGLGLWACMAEADKASRVAAWANTASTLYAIIVSRP
jgi:hypothetical protein